MHFKGKEIQDIDTQAEKVREWTPHVVFSRFLFPPYCMKCCPFRHDKCSYSIWKAVRTLAFFVVFIRRFLLGRSWQILPSGYWRSHQELAGAAFNIQHAILLSSEICCFNIVTKEFSFSFKVPICEYHGLYVNLKSAKYTMVAHLLFFVRNPCWMLMVNKEANKTMAAATIPNN